MGRKRKAPTQTPAKHVKFDETRFNKKSKTEDHVFIIEGKKMYVSKTVLTIASPVFASMFESDFKEKHLEEIELKGKKYKDMLEFVKLLYPGSRNPVTMGTVFLVLPLAEEYQVDTIKYECEQCLLHEVEKRTSSRRSKNVKILCQILQFSSLYNIPTVEKTCIDILSKIPQKQVDSAEKSYPLPDKSKNKLLTKVNRRLQERITSIEDAIEFKDHIIELKEDDISDLRRQIQEANKERETLRQKLSDRECENRSEGIIKLEFTVSCLTTAGQLSDPKKFRGLNWRCKVTRECIPGITGDEHLGFWACFDPGFPNMEMNAIASFKVLNNKGADFLCYTSETLFTTKNCSWGYGDKLKWEEFIDPEKGYVVDDKARIELFLVTFKPRFGNE
ncbi:uncharacterized protein LOC123551805 [Mercenaria mercenaria]|uniref:uncharacterized protein LOC123551805 n=1 Tax=Mercenaria mercenaria TaxID=6596 RepID=UPI00234EBDF9|nr:uncharacterized protein LOC123551805 [Mercenaria mercenaria]